MKSVTRKHELWNMWLLGDWIVIICMILFLASLYDVAPTYLEVKDPETHYPDVKSSALSSGIIMPLIIFICAVPIILYFFFTKYFFKQRYDPSDLIHVVLGLAQCGFSSSLIAEILKRISGRPRPNFYSLTDADQEDFRRQSFPSWHATVTFSILTFLSLWIIGKLKLRNTKTNNSYKIAIGSLPLVLAFYQASSRVNEYAQHFDDALAGAVIGMVECFLVLTYSRQICGFISYRLYYPSVFSIHSNFTKWTIAQMFSTDMVELDSDIFLLNKDKNPASEISVKHRPSFEKGYDKLPFNKMPSYRSGLTDEAEI